MKPSFSPKRVFYWKSSILLMLFLINACVKDDITNISHNAMIKQSFSIPIGEKEVRIIPQLPISDTSSTSPIGTYYYNNLPYPITSREFTISEALNFDLTNKPNNSWVKKITFNILTVNSYLTHTNLQIYLTDSNGRILDTFGQISTNGASTYTDTIVYEGARLELLKQAKILVYIAKMSATSTLIRVTDENKFNLSIGAKAELEYYAKELNN
jgi:hypothetical protein